MQQTTTPFLNSCNQWNYLTPVISELKCSHHRQFGIEKLIATTVFKLILKWKLCNSNYRCFGCNYPSIPFLWSPGEHPYYPISITVTGVIQAAGNRWTLIHPIAVSYDHPIPLLPWGTDEFAKKIRALGDGGFICEQKIINGSSRPPHSTCMTKGGLSGPGFGESKSESEHTIL